MIEQLLYTLVLIIPLSATILFLFILLLCKILKSYSSQFIFFLLKVGIFISIMPNLVIAKAIFEIYSREKLLFLTQSEDFINTAFMKAIAVQWQSEKNAQVAIVLLLIWVIVNIGVITSKFYHQYKFRNTLLDSCIKMDEENKLIVELLEELDIKIPIMVYKSEIIDSPVTIGVLHPAIVLPAKKIWECFDLEEKKSILRHELIHCKRRDLLFKKLASILAVIYWYNPVARFYNKELLRYCEFSCDEKVIEKYSSNGKIQYSNTIWKSVKLIRGTNSDDMMSFVDKDGENPEEIKRRLEKLMRVSVKKIGKIGIAAITTTLIAASTLVSYAASTSILRAEDQITNYVIEQQVSENSFEEFTLPVEIAAGEEAVFTMSIDPRGITELELPLDRGDTVCVRSVSLEKGTSVNVVFEAESSDDKFYVGLGTETDDMVYTVSKSGAVNHRFTTPKDGLYEVRVKNASSHSILVTGIIYI